MLIGIVSDTHDSIRNFRKAINFFNAKKIDLLIHCGDWVSPFMLELIAELNCKCLAIFGNNEHDRERYFKKIEEMNLNIELHDNLFEGEIDGKKIAIFHGHYGHIMKMLLEKDFDVIFTGHTHIPEATNVDKIKVINPGSCAGIIRGLKQQDKFSIALYNTETDSSEIVYLE